MLSQCFFYTVVVFIVGVLMLFIYNGFLLILKFTLIVLLVLDSYFVPNAQLS